MEVPDLNGKTVTQGVAYLGALNWGAMEVANTNIITKLLGTGSKGAAYLAIGLAGAVSVSEWLEITEIFD